MSMHLFKSVHFKWSSFSKVTGISSNIFVNVHPPPMTYLTGLKDTVVSDLTAQDAHFKVKLLFFFNEFSGCFSISAPHVPNI